MLFTAKRAAEIAAIASGRKTFSLNKVGNWQSMGILTHAPGKNRSKRYTVIHIMEMTVMSLFLKDFRGTSPFYHSYRRWLWHSGPRWLRREYDARPFLVLTPIGAESSKAGTAIEKLSESLPLIMVIDLATVCSKIREVEPNAFEDFQQNRAERISKAPVRNVREKHDTPLSMA